MNKREMIHALIDKLLDVAESGTKKELNFYFMTLSDCQSFDFRFCEGNGSKQNVRPSFGVYFGNSLQRANSLELALKEIELIKDTPDVEPKVNLNISIDRARELGLIS